MRIRTSGMPFNRVSFRLWPVVLLGLMFFGAMFWAKGRDPFQRIWFKVKVPGQGKAECIAVVPKISPKSEVQSLKPEAQDPESKVQGPKSGGGRWPVVVYLHGSGGSLLEDGNELRQMAEMGLAAVGMEYEQRAEDRGQGTEVGDAFEAQFTALLEYLQRQSWADTNRIAWVGYSLGAQRLLSFAVRHPDLQPSLLVRLAGGWVPELQSGVQSLKSKVPGLESKVQSPKSNAEGSLSELSTLNHQLLCCSCTVSATTSFRSPMPSALLPVCGRTACRSSFGFCRERATAWAPAVCSSSASSASNAWPG